MKIQDGCDAGCAYCIVPLARGPNRSLPAADVLAQVTKLVAAGLPRDWCSPACTWAPGAATWRRAQTLAGLLARLVAIPGLERLRLSSIEPTEFTPELLDLLAASPAICPHLHIPLQSGSAAVLRAMGRPYGPEVFARVVERLALTLPDPGLGADVIAGFPGEREEDFEQTVEPHPLAAADLPARLPLFAAARDPRRRDGRPGARRGARPARRGPARAGPRENRGISAQRHVGRTVRALIQGQPGRKRGATHGLTGNYLTIFVRAHAGRGRRFSQPASHRSRRGEASWGVL